MSVTTHFRQRTDGSDEFAREGGTGGDHDAQMAAPGVVDTVDARVVALAPARVETRHDQRGDAVTVVGPDRLDVDDARHNHVPRACSGRLGRLRRTCELVERVPRNPVFLADAFRGEPAVPDESPDGFWVDVEARRDVVDRVKLLGDLNARHGSHCYL